MSDMTVKPPCGFFETTGLSPEIMKCGMVHSNDIGFDPDDFWAFAALACGERLDAAITTLYKPGEKAAILTRFIDMLVANELIPESSADKTCKIRKRVFAGVGYYETPEMGPEDRRIRFNAMYPSWPTERFGDVGREVDEDYKCVYPFQLSNIKGADISTVPQDAKLEEFIEYLKGVQGQIVMVATGPLSNEAELLRRVPALFKEKVSAIFMMNGTFMNPPRMGYNGVLNVRDTDLVFKSGVPCIIASSQLCKGYNLSPEIFAKIQANKDSLDELGQTMHEMMMNWQIHVARKKDPNVDVAKLNLTSPIFADPLAALIALDPDCVKSLRPVSYEFNMDVADDPEFDMLNFKLNGKLVKVVEDPASNVFEVMSLKDPEGIQAKLDELAQMVFIFKEEEGGGIKEGKEEQMAAAVSEPTET